MFGTRLMVSGTRLMVFGTRLMVFGTRLTVFGTKLKEPGSYRSLFGTVLWRLTSREISAALTL